MANHLRASQSARAKSTIHLWYNILSSDIYPWTLSVPRSSQFSLSENCSLLGTDNVCGQLSEHIFAPNGGYCLFTISQIFSLARHWSKHVTRPNNWGISEKISPNFQDCARCVKDLKDDKHDTLHLGRKYARIFVLGHYLFLEAHKLRSRKTARFSEQIMSADKYTIISIFSR